MLFARLIRANIQVCPYTKKQAAFRSCSLLLSSHPPSEFYFLTLSINFSVLEFIRGMGQDYLEFCLFQILDVDRSCTAGALL